LAQVGRTGPHTRAASRVRAATDLLEGAGGTRFLAAPMGDIEVEAAIIEHGIDERAQELLRGLSQDHQHVVIEKLAAGVAAGKVRNASAYVVGVCRGPDLLEIDENAVKALNDLPAEARQAIVEKLRRTEDVRNPSAWVIKAVMTAKEAGRNQIIAAAHGLPSPGVAPMGGFAGGPPRMTAYAGVVGLDDGAKALLQTLPGDKQAEIMSRLQQQAGVKNPSGWVVKAAIEAGATPLQGGPGGGRGMGAAMAQQPMGMQMHMGGAQYGSMPSAHGRSSVLGSLDAAAQGLLASLPAQVQQDLIGKLETDPTIRNPSAWVAKAAMQAGAAPNRSSGAPRQTFTGQGPPPPAPPGMQLQLDARAQELLATITPEAQQEIMAKLQNTPEVRNPSAWVAKAALKAGATTSPSLNQVQQPSGFGPIGTRQAGDARASPYTF